MKQLSLIDAVMLEQESPRTPNHLCIVGIYDPSTAPDGAPTYADIVESVDACLAEAPSLRRKLLRLPFGVDRPYWVDDTDFDIEFHLRQLALPKPGDWRQLRVQVARLHARGLDLTRPPWEMTVIEGLDSVEGLPPGCFATVLKVHHSAIDGVSGVELMNVIHDLAPDAERRGAPEPWEAKPVPPMSALLRQAGMHAVMNPVNAVRLVASSASPLASELIGTVRGPRLSSAAPPRTRFQQRVSAHRVFDNATCPLATLKRIKAAVPGTTINDVCLSIIGGAMRSYLNSIGEPPDGPLLTLVPVSTRTPDQAGEGGNQISVMRVPLHTDIDDPLLRLAAIHDTTLAKKAAQDGVAVPVLLDVARVLPGALIGAAARALGPLSERGPVIANTIVTNVPGSPVPLYFLGCELVHSTGAVPLVDGVGLFHCVSSYRGQLTFMVTACRELLPDPEAYVKSLDSSIAEHLHAAEVALAAEAGV